MLAHCIKPGGVFINIGPLLWHFAESKNDISIELSWEDVVKEWYDNGAILWRSEGASTFNS